MLYQIVSENGQKVKKSITGNGYGLPLGTWIGYEGACPDGFLEAGTTFNTTTYAALYAMLGSNKVPERFDHSKLSDWELKQAQGVATSFSFTTNYDGFLYVKSYASSANNHGFYIYLDGDTTFDYGGNFHGGYGTSNVTIPYKKGQSIQVDGFIDGTPNNYFSVSVREYKQHLAIKATPAYVEPDTVSDMMAVINRNNAYSLEETPTGKTWIDGKPIYRKVIENPTLGATLLTNVSDVIFYTAKRKWSANDSGLVYFDGNSGYNSILLDINSGVVSIRKTETAYNTSINYIILEYTKTTD